MRGSLSNPVPGSASMSCESNEKALSKSEHSKSEHFDNYGSEFFDVAIAEQDEEDAKHARVQELAPIHVLPQLLCFL